MEGGQTKATKQSEDVCLTSLKYREELAQEWLIAEEYGKTINVYIERRLPSQSSLNGEAILRCLVPTTFFLVGRMGKSTTKVRIVFDYSAKFEGVFFNDVMHPGRKLLTYLVNVLLRFRRAPVAVAFDIR